MSGYVLRVSAAAPHRRSLQAATLGNENSASAAEQDTATQWLMRSTMT